MSGYYGNAYNNGVGPDGTASLTSRSHSTRTPPTFKLNAPQASDDVVDENNDTPYATSVGADRVIVEDGHHHHNTHPGSNGRNRHSDASIGDEGVPSSSHNRRSHSPSSKSASKKSKKSKKSHKKSKDHDDKSRSSSKKKSSKEKKHVEDQHDVENRYHTGPAAGFDNSINRDTFNDKNKADNSSSDDDSSSTGNGKSALTNCMSTSKLFIVIGISAVLVLIVLIIVVSITLASRNNNDGGKKDLASIGAPTPAPTSIFGGTGPTLGGGTSPTFIGGGGSSPSGGGGSISSTLNRIKATGILNCGVPIDQPGFAIVNPTTGQMEGFDADLCRAVAAAIFGTSQGRVEFFPVSGFDRFFELESGKYDVLARTTTHTMERQILEPRTKKGFDFTVPYLYNGLQFAGKPPYVGCANNFTTAGDCALTRICVLDSTTHQGDIIGRNPGLQVVSAPSSAELYSFFIDERCNVIAGEQFDIAEAVVRDRGYLDDEFEIGAGIHSKEPLCMVTKDDDRQWSDFVNWVMIGLLAAEDHGVSQSTAASIPRSGVVFGVDYRDMFRNAVKDVGNYGEIYKRHLEAILPRPTPDKINSGATGLIYSFPTGSTTSNIGSGAERGGTLEAILNRGRLRCGISRRPIFATFDQTTRSWEGIDIDFCRAITAAIFDGQVDDKVDFVDLEQFDRLERFENGDVDILASGESVDLELDVLESTTGVGKTFSLPTFYDGLTFAGIAPYAGCADDLDSSSNTCSSLIICVTSGTPYEERVKSLFPARFINSKNSRELVVRGLINGECNVIAGSVDDVSVTNVNNAGLNLQNVAYEIVPTRFSKGPLALMTREDDVQFSAFVFWIVSIIFAAEEDGINQSQANRLPSVNLFGPAFMSMFRNAINVVGNYAEIYERNAQSEIPRGGLNLLNVNLGGPQHYPPPGVIKGSYL